MWNLKKKRYKFKIIKSILSDIYIATPTFFLFPFAWNAYFVSLSFIPHFQSVSVFRSEVILL